VGRSLENQKAALGILLEFGQPNRIREIQRGKRTATGSTRRGARFSSKSSLKERDPIGQAGEEPIHCAKIVFLEVREIPQYLFLGHPGCQIRGHVVDCDPKTPYAGLAAHFARFKGDAGIKAHHKLPVFIIAGVENSLQPGRQRG
jgi:hypothetical protein